MTILGESAAAITMICDILDSNGKNEPLRIVNNIDVDVRLPYAHPRIIIKRGDSVIENDTCILGAVMPKTKLAVFTHFNIPKILFRSQIHKSAIHSSTSVIGHGVLLDALCTVCSYVTLGDFVTVYAGAVVSHHSTVGNFSTICPNAAIGGEVRIGDRTFIGIGASIKNGITIGDDCVIGAGAVVVHDVENGTVVKGNPAA